MIKVYSEDYDRKEFYSLMGKFFAEPMYKKVLPYMTNRKNTVWYVNIQNGEVEAFAAVEIHQDRIHFRTDYFVNDIRFLEELLIYRLNNLPNQEIDTATGEEQIKNLFEIYGFIEYRRTKNYTFMIREASEDDKD